jgi:hypothetical protein
MGGGHRLEDRMQSSNGMISDLYGIIGDGDCAPRHRLRGVDGAIMLPNHVRVDITRDYASREEIDVRICSLRSGGKREFR